jgi:hypothetical protein|tara:strand:- start:13095 stop:13451 length:357 start_codon:yes stop_codon:yes gene_type:complete
MPILNFTFSQQLNTSIQVGDIVYYVPTISSAQFNVNSTDIIEIGPITMLFPSNLGFSASTTLPPLQYPTSSDYIFFTKDNKVNQSNVLGYFAKVQLKNNSLDEAEIFNVSADAFDSSK